MPSADGSATESECLPRGDVEYRVVPCRGFCHPVCPLSWGSDICTNTDRWLHSSRPIEPSRLTLFSLLCCDGDSIHSALGPRSVPACPTRPPGVVARRADREATLVGGLLATELERPREVLERCAVQRMLPIVVPNATPCCGTADCWEGELSRFRAAALRRTTLRDTKSSAVRLSSFSNGTLICREPVMLPTTRTLRPSERDSNLSLVHGRSHCLTAACRSDRVS